MPANFARQRQGIGHGRLISDDSESDIRIEIESLNAQVTRAAYFEHGLGFSRPQRIVEFIERDDGAYWDADWRTARSPRAQRWLSQIASRFDAVFGDYDCLGHMSNGEGVYAKRAA